MSDVKCSECAGSGSRWLSTSSFDEEPEETCQWCEGRGRIPRHIQEMIAALSMLFPFAPVTTSYREVYDGATGETYHIESESRLGL